MTFTPTLLFNLLFNTTLFAISAYKLNKKLSWWNIFYFLFWTFFLAYDLGAIG